MKIMKSITAALCVCLASCATAMAQEAKPKHSVLITNARIFDGQHEALATGMSVLVEGNKIAKIAKSIPAPVGATVIDAKGRVLMPGLIDAHWHTVYTFWPISKVVSSDMGLLSLAAAKAHKETLMRGFTTVRDAGEKGVWWSTQPMDATGEDAFKFESPISTAKYGQAVAGVEKVVVVVVRQNQRRPQQRNGRGI